MEKIFNLIQKLTKYSNEYYYPSILRIKILQLNCLADEFIKSNNTDHFQEIKKIIFRLLETIPDYKNISNDFILLFSELIIVIIEEETKQKHDISDLISAFNHLSLSFDLEKSLSNLTID